jgi:hypothetical protein
MYLRTLTMNNRSSNPSSPSDCVGDQGCQMVYFQTKNPNLGNFGKVLQWKMLVYFMAILSIFLLFGALYDYLPYFMVIWYIFVPRKIWQPCGWPIIWRKRHKIKTFFLKPGLSDKQLWEVQNIFRWSKRGKIASCYFLKGHFFKSSTFFIQQTIYIGIGRVLIFFWKVLKSVGVNIRLMAKKKESSSKRHLENFLRQVKAVEKILKYFHYNSSFKTVLLPPMCVHCDSNQ